MATIEVQHGDHAMLRRASVWNQIATGFVRLALGLPSDEGLVSQAFQAAEAGGPRLQV